MINVYNNKSYVNNKKLVSEHKKRKYTSIQYATMRQWNMLGRSILPRPDGFKGSWGISLHKNASLYDRVYNYEQTRESK